MSTYRYDLHVHSCASPCADDDMTPANIAGMAVVQGLNLVALTDHNTCRNCPAFFVHAKKYGIVPVPGMELTTSEDIHVLCLFKTLESAMAFDRLVGEKRTEIENRPDIFGHQYVMDENDEILEEIRPLLINATSLDLEEAYRQVQLLDGVCYPAHIDRESNGMIAVLGDLPEQPAYTAFELNDASSLNLYRSRYPRLEAMRYVVSSDAHQLWKISDGSHTLELEDEPYSSARVREALIDYLKGCAPGTYP